MFKKIIASMCILTGVLTQTAFADSDAVMLISNQTAKDNFYAKYGIEKRADVFYNGEYIYYEDAQPLVLNGTTFVPIRNFCDALGAEVGFVNETKQVTIKYGDDIISFVAGSADIDVNGKTFTLTSSTFVAEDRTMVPARLISEAFDLDVSWNSYDKQVIINDVNALKHLINNELTIVNGILDIACTNANEIYTENSEMIGYLELLYDIYGVSFDYEADYTSIYDKNSNILDFNISSKLDSSGYISFLNEQVKNDQMNEFRANQVIAYLELFEAFDLGLLVDVSNDYLYFSSDKMEYISQFFNIDSDTLDNDTTLKYKLGLSSNQNSALSEQLTDLSEQLADLSIEKIVDMILDQATDFDHFELGVYKAILDVLEPVRDSNFTKNADVYTLNHQVNIFDTDVSLNLQVKLNSNGSVSSYIIEVDLDNDEGTVYFNFSQESIFHASCELKISSDYGFDDENFELLFKSSVVISQTNKSASSIPTTNVVEIQ